MLLMHREMAVFHCAANADAVLMQLRHCQCVPVLTLVQPAALPLCWVDVTFLLAACYQHTWLCMHWTVNTWMWIICACLSYHGLDLCQVAAGMVDCSASSFAPTLAYSSNTGE